MVEAGTSNSQAPLRLGDPQDVPQASNLNRSTTHIVVSINSNMVHLIVNNPLIIQHNPNITL